MSEKSEDNKGCTSMIVLIGILIVGLIIRFVIDKEDLFKDMWGGFLGLLIILSVVWVANNYRKN